MSKFLKIHINKVWIGKIVDGPRTYGVPLRDYLSSFKGYLLFEEVFGEEDIYTETLTGEKAMIVKRHYNSSDKTVTYQENIDHASYPCYPKVEGEQIYICCDINNPLGIADFQGTKRIDVPRDLSETKEVGSKEAASFYNNEDSEDLKFCLKNALLEAKQELINHEKIEQARNNRSSQTTQIREIKTKKLGNR